ncbi:MAG: hypothetical protein IPP85_19050 [Propionivibrio sp.]|nr:hypothetical protein [Propionivibrio sp.]
MTIRNLPPPVTSQTLSGTSLIPLPPAWQALVDSQLAGDEKVLAWLEIDLIPNCVFPSACALLGLTEPPAGYGER